MYPGPPLCALVAPYFAVSGRDLLLDGALFKNPCSRLAIYSRVVEGLGWGGGSYWSWDLPARVPEYA